MRLFCFAMISGSDKKLSMTDKMMSDQVYILISDVPIYETVV